VIDYHCAKFGDFSFSSFGFIVRTADNHIEGYTHTIADVDDRYTQATTVGVSSLMMMMMKASKLVLLAAKQYAMITIIMQYFMRC